MPLNGRSSKEFVDILSLSSWSHKLTGYIDFRLSLALQEGNSMAELGIEGMILNSVGSVRGTHTPEAAVQTFGLLLERERVPPLERGVEGGGMGFCEVVE